MTQEEKQLLFKDLSARLPYHVKVKVWVEDGTTEEGALDLEHNYANVLLDAFYYNKIKDIKPYLRPMSSMTNEEKEEYHKLCDNYYDIYFNSYDIYFNSVESIDWLNKYHFDYRGLIEKGFALEAPKDMYNK